MAESPTFGTGSSDEFGPAQIPPHGEQPSEAPSGQPSREKPSREAPSREPPHVVPQPEVGPFVRALRDFDPRAVHPLDWTTMGLGVLAFVASFASFYSYTETVTISGFSESRTQSWNAWHGIYGWLGALAALAAAGVLAADLLGIDLLVPARLMAVSAFSFALLMLIVALVVVPSRLGFNGVGVLGIRTTEGHAFGYWLSLVVVFAGSALALVRFLSKG